MLMLESDRAKEFQFECDKGAASKAVLENTSDLVNGCKLIRHWCCPNMF